MLKSRMSAIVIAGIMMGGAFYLIHGLDMQSLRNQPAIYIAQFTVSKYGLFAYSSDLKEEKKLLNFPVSPVAGVAKNSEGKKLLVRDDDDFDILKNNTLEYDIAKKNHKNLEDAVIIQNTLGDMDRSGHDLQIINLKYIPNSENYSFIYGTHGDTEGNGTLFIMNREAGSLDAVNQVDGNSGYQWTKDGLGLYFVRESVLYFKNMVSGEEEMILERVENFAVSSDDLLVALWRKQEDGQKYILYLYNMKEKTEKKVKHSETQYGHAVCFSPDDTFLLFIVNRAGFLGELLNGSKPVMKIYNIKRAKIVKTRTGDYSESWWGITW